MALIIFLLTILVITGLARRIYKYPFAPLRLFSLVWGVVLLLYLSNPCHYETPADHTLILLWSSFVAFSLGCICVSVDRRREKSYQSTITKQINETSLKKIILLLALFGLFGSLLFFYLTIQKFGILTLIFSPMVIRKSIYSFNSVELPILSGRLAVLLNLLLACNFAAALLGATHHLYLRRNYLPAYIPIISIIIFDIAYMGRFHILATMIIYVLGYWATLKLVDEAKRRTLAKSGKWIIAISVVLSISTVVILAVLLNKYKASTNMLWDIEVPNVVYMLTSDMTGPLASFDYILRERVHELQYGGHTFFTLDIYLYQFMRQVVDTNIVMHNNLEDYQNVIKLSSDRAFNALFTYLRYFYDDFGEAGVIICPFLFGALATLLYHKMLKTKSIIVVSLTILMLMSIVTSIWWWQFVEIYMFNTVVLLLFIFRRSGHKRSPVLRPQKSVIMGKAIMNGMMKN